jgi:hypothetical protein
MTLDEFFSGWEESRRIFDALCNASDVVRQAELRVKKSQVAFYRRKAFAWIWIPGMYLRDATAPLVLTISFRRRDLSPRWKEIVQPRPGRFTHHLEIRSVSEIDDEIRAWLLEAWNTEG